MALEEEPQQTHQKKEKHLRVPQEVFHQYKDPKTCFYPFYDLLASELRVRFRKSLIKAKEILFKDKSLQIGVLTSLHNDIEIDMTIIYTNLSESTIVFKEIDYHFTKDLPVIKNYANIRQKIKGSQQLKLQLKVIVNSIDGRCPTLVVKYQEEGKSREELTLLLPVSKLKLMQTLPYTSHYEKQYQRLERVVRPEKRILSNPHKIKDYW